MATDAPTIEFRADEAFARELDERDPLRGLRDRFALPLAADGQPAVYFCGHSLGLQPKAAPGLVQQEMEDWARLAVDGHFQGQSPWYTYHETVREPLARLLGARPHEVVAMNTLTVNLHLMMVSFFRPTESRFRILIDGPTFPSDLYAVKSHLRTRGLDPAEALIELKPRDGEQTLRPEDIDSTLDEHGDSIALVLMSGVNYFTGQCYDMARLTERAHAKGCIVGWDLAHAAGNVPLALHDWNVDFACCCTYKYLNSGPGSVAGCFVHERHAANPDLPRYAGWWGNDPETRFRMHLEPEFIPTPSADGWQISNPPIFSLAPLRASLDLFDEAGMGALREKSLALSGFLRWLVQQQSSEQFEIITPHDADAHGAHGAQVSVLLHDQPRARRDALQASGVVCDFREPNVIRAAPTPLYNTYHEVWRFARTLGAPMS